MQNASIEDFFHQLNRKDFLDKFKYMASLNKPLPIGHGQTISQPTLVLDMTVKLDLTPDSKVLEIGTGSGYQTCLLARFSKEVYTVERIQDLSSKAEQRLSAMGYMNIHYIHSDGSLGWPEGAPYDRIMVTAAASQIPEELLEQLAPEGVMIIPVGSETYQHICKVIKNAKGHVQTTQLYAVRFVPLVGKYSI